MVVKLACTRTRMLLQQFDLDEKELLDSFIGLWQQPTALFPEACQRYEEEEYIPKEKLFEVLPHISSRDQEHADILLYFFMCLFVFNLPTCFYLARLCYRV